MLSAKGSSTLQVEEKMDELREIYSRRPEEKTNRSLQNQIKAFRQETLQLCHTAQDLGNHCIHAVPMVTTTSHGGEPGPPIFNQNNTNNHPSYPSGVRIGLGPSVSGLCGAAEGGAAQQEPAEDQGAAGSLGRTDPAAAVRGVLQDIPRETLQGPEQ